MGDIMRKYETISIDLKKRIENGEFEENKYPPAKPVVLHLRA